VIVDFHGELHQRVVLDTIAGGRRAPVGIGARSAEIMQFRVHRAARRDRTRLPSRLEKPPAISSPKRVSAVWTFGLGGTPKTGTYWTVNGKPFDPKRVDHVVRLGSTQTRLLRNLSSATHGGTPARDVGVDADAHGHADDDSGAEVDGPGCAAGAPRAVRCSVIAGPRPQPLGTRAGLELAALVLLLGSVAAVRRRRTGFR
jgi:hypothetical protein